ncbi:MAG TPA: ribosome recycling factor [Actinomycetota bacterium]|nr:ribosome recycling factor [Actinomycetota bacterium]
MSTPEAQQVLKEADRKMDGAVKVCQDDLAAIRTGRASPALVERITIDYYGTPTPLNQLAQLNTPEARLLVIQPYDKSTIPSIEKAVMQSDLGVTPSNDGSVIRLPFPALTEDRRKDLVKVAHKRAEDGRVAVRNVRRHAKDELEKMSKDGTISQDELHRAEKQLQQETDSHVKRIDEMLATKEQELSEV